MKMKFLLILPPDYYIALGEIAATWTWLEHQLGVLIRLGFRLNKAEGRILTVGMAVKPKSHVLRITALKLVDNIPARQALIAFAKKIQDLIDARNDYIHGLWVETVETPKQIGLFVTRSGEQRYQPEFDPVPLEKLQEVVKQLRELQDEAQRLTDVLKGRRPNPALQPPVAPSGRLPLHPSRAQRG